MQLKFSIGLITKLLLRQSAKGNLRLLAAAIILAVICISLATVVINGVKFALDDTTGELLGGDRVLTSPREIPEELATLAQRAGVKTSRSTVFYSMLSVTDNMRLASVKAVSNYPLKGQVKVGTKIEVPEALSYGPTGTEVWLEPQLAAALDAKIGDEITIGATQFVFSKLLLYEPDKLAGSNFIAPRAMVSWEQLDAMQVIQPGSRIKYKMAFAGSKEAFSVLDPQIKEKIEADDLYLQSRHEQPNVKNFLTKGEQYFGLAAIVNVILAGVVVAISARRMASFMVQPVAVLQSLGMSFRAVFSTLSLGLLILSIILGVIGSGLGMMLGQLILQFIAKFFTLKSQIPPNWWSIAVGVWVAIVLTLGFALPTLFNLRAITPKQLFAGKSWHMQFTSKLIVFVAVITATILLQWQVQAWDLTLGIVVGLILLATALYALLDALFDILGFVAKKFNPLLRHGLLNITRHKILNILIVQAFALCLAGGLLLFLVAEQLLHTWQASIPQDAPNYFVINVAPTKVAALEQELQQANIKSSAFYPLVRGRLIAVGSNKVAYGNWEEDAKININRPLNLTWTNVLPEDNKVIAGKWFGEQQEIQLSVEQKFAARINAKIGDTLTFQVGAEVITATITSIRQVQWDTMQPNFYVIYPQGIIDHLPHTYMASFYLPERNLNLINNIFQRYREASIIDAATVLQQVRMVLATITQVISILWYFTLVLSIVLLMSVVVTSLSWRNQDNKILRLLGASRRHLYLILTAEFSSLAIIASVIAAGIASIAAFVVTKYTFAIEFKFVPELFAYALLLGLSTIMATAILALRRSVK